MTREQIEKRLKAARKRQVQIDEHIKRLQSRIKRLQTMVKKWKRRQTLAPKRIAWLEIKLITARLLGS